MIMKVIFSLADNNSSMENWCNIGIQNKAAGTLFLIEGTVIQYSILCWVHTHAHAHTGYMVGDNKKQRGNLISI